MAWFFSLINYSIIKTISMKTKIFTLALSLLLLSLALSAQVVSKDSINSLKNEKAQLEIAKKINENKLKLAKLENQLDSRTNELYRTRDEAEKAAIENQHAANELASDPQDNKKAKAAKRAGNRAESSAKKASKAADKLKDLSQDIDDLKKKIADDEQKLNVTSGTSLNS